jgi:hypothetical protein
MSILVINSPSTLTHSLTHAPSLNGAVCVCKLLQWKPSNRRPPLAATPLLTADKTIRAIHNAYPTLSFQSTLLTLLLERVHCFASPRLKLIRKIRAIYSNSLTPHSPVGTALEHNGYCAIILFALYVTIFLIKLVYNGISISIYYTCLKKLAVV